MTITPAETQANCQEDLSTAVVHWEGISIYGDCRWDDFALLTLDGWDAFSATRQTAKRPYAHGQWATRAFVQKKTVTITGYVYSLAQRDELFSKLTQSFSLPGSGGLPRPLRIENMGRDLFAPATLLEFDGWNSYTHVNRGLFGFKAQWELDDPYRYAADEDGVYTTGLDDGRASGLEFPLFDDQDTGNGEDLYSPDDFKNPTTKTTGALEFGEPSESGRVVFQNRGTTDAWPIFEVTSTSPFRIVHGESGRTIEYSATVPNGQVLVIDQQAATAILQGTGDRSANLTRREWFSIPAGQQGTIRFVTDTLYNPLSKMTVRVRSTYL